MTVAFKAFPGTRRPILLSTLAILLAQAHFTHAATPPSCARPTGEKLSAPVSALIAGRLEGGAATGRLSASPKAVVVYFGASWCAPCRVQVRAMKAAYKAGDPQHLGYEVVMVSLDATAAAAADYAASEQMPWAYLPPKPGGRAREVAALGGRSAPDMVVADAQGRILCRAYTPTGRYLGVSQTFAAMRRALGATD